MNFHKIFPSVSLFTIFLSVAIFAKPTPQIFTFESDSSGFNTKNYFYDNGEEVVAFDTQFTEKYANESIAFLKTKTKSPIKYLVITHPNPDKFNAISSFKKLGAKVVASRQTTESLPGVYNYKKYYWTKIAKAFTEKNYPRLGKVDQTFEKEFSLRLKNGDVVKLTEFGTKGVSSNQTVAFIENLNSWIVGDLIHFKAHAWLEGGIINGKPSPDLKEWIKTLDSLKNIGNSDSQVFAGRGLEGKLNEVVKEQIKYLKIADEIVTDYISDLGNKKSELTSDKASFHYSEIQKIFVKRFPEYQLDYMIGYGVYGLVNSKL